MKPIQSSQEQQAVSRQKVLENVFPQQYLDVMSQKTKTLFLSAFNGVLSRYKKRDDFGYKNNGKLRLYPKLRDLKAPYELCDLEGLKAIIIAVEPYNNGEATGIPFEFKSDYRADFQLKKQQDVDCLDYSVRTNFTTYKVTEEPNYNKKGKLLKRPKKVVSGEIVHGIDWEFMAEQGVLVIHASLTSEEKSTYRHFNTWLPFTVEFLRDMYSYKIATDQNCFTILTIGDIFRNVFNPMNLRKLDDALFMKKIEIISAPNAYFDVDSRDTFTRFSPFKRLNQALKKSGYVPLSFINEQTELNND